MKVNYSSKQYDQLHLHGWTACAVRTQIQAGTFTIEDLITALFKRIYQTEPQVGAWEWLLAEDHALSLARASDKLYAEGCAGPLEGIPIGIKDIIETAGMPTRMGSPIFADYVPDTSATVIRLLEDAGAIIMGKTVTTEFATQAPGKTRNPWNVNHTPGGSSSGSAAAVAAGFVPLAVGTQTRGSTIRPAAYCGVTGYKPTAGLISTKGVFPTSNTLDCIGFFANTVQDVTLLASICGRLRVSAGLSHRPVIAMVETPYDKRASGAQRLCLERSAQSFANTGARVERVRLPAAFSDALEITNCIQRYELVQLHQSRLDAWENAISWQLRAYIDEGRNITAKEYAQALQKRDQLIALYDELAQKYSFILTHPADGEAPVGIQGTGDATLCTIWTLCAAPSIALPVCLGPGQLPLGIQLVGRRDMDTDLLAFAKWCETILSATRDVRKV